MNVDFFMNEALIEANKAFLSNEIPVGAILVENHTQEIISRNYNQMHNHNNPIKHCEINLIVFSFNPFFGFSSSISVTKPYLYLFLLYESSVLRVSEFTILSSNSLI